MDRVLRCFLFILFFFLLLDKIYEMALCLTISVHKQNLSCNSFLYFLERSNSVTLSKGG